MTEKGHLYEYVYRCRNAPFGMAHFFFPFEMRHFGIGDKIDVEMPKCPIFGYVLVIDAKMSHFKGKKEMGHFGIGMRIHASGLSLSQPFWGILAILAYVKNV